MLDSLRQRIMADMNNEMIHECIVDLTESLDIKDEVLTNMLNYTSVDDVTVSSKETNKLTKVLEQIPENDDGEPLTTKDFEEAEREPIVPVSKAQLEELTERIIYSSKF